MSRAFVKESDGNEVDRDLPELRVSPHRNLVTQRGFDAIEAEARRLAEALSAARADGDEALALRLARDLRYWASRRGNAEIVPPAPDFDSVRFGMLVTLGHDDGHRKRYRIVGEDEAAPATGTISWVSPLATALLGLGVGDEVTVGGDRWVLLAIEP
jgi:transcription elongation GreA/GreB family factor